MPTTAIPTLLQDPGYLLGAPIGSTLPTMTVVGSKFTDAWPGAWVSLGATEDGSDFTYETKVEAVYVAEFIDAILWNTTERTGSFAFSLTNFTLTNMSKAFNGGTLAIVSGTGTTQLNRLDPPDPGNEVRMMIGWESLDGTVRIIAYQCLQGGSMKATFKKRPAVAGIPCTFNFEKPSATEPFSMWSAGTARA
jgi:hypothetical protein